MIFTQGLAAEDSGSIVQDDTCVGLTNRRLIAIDRQKRPPGRERGWLERLHLRRRDTSKGKHTLIFETPREGLFLSVRLAVFYLARMNIRTEDGHTFSVGLNSRYWAEQATMLSKEQESNGPT
jgi:hypothetical protein